MSALTELTVTDATGSEVRLGDLLGAKATLVVNVASQCGLTPQYAPLQDLYAAEGGNGLAVLGFPCNQFMGQEPGTDAEIQAFCEGSFGVTFPVLAKLEVNGAGAHELFRTLEETPDPEGYTGDVRWNFEKFLLDAAGTPVARFAPPTTPDDPAVKAAIQVLLA